MAPAAPNLLLSVLSASVRDSLLSRASTVELPTGTVLHEPGVAPRHAYFLLNGLASLVVDLEGGASAEVNMIGREGVVNGMHVLGGSPIPTRCTMQLGGAGLRIPMALQGEFAASEELRSRMLEFLQYQSAVVSQIAGCNRLHSAEERLVRWLLMASDKTGFDLLVLTHEYLAQMLATHRPTVTLAAGDLQSRGLIQYSRGTMRLMDRPGLEAVACSCYGVIRDLHAKLYRGEEALSLRPA